MLGVGVEKDDAALFSDGFGPAVVHIGGGMKSNPRMAMIVVVLMSVIHSWLGPSRRKSRLTRSSVVSWWSGVGFPLLRLGSSLMPSSTMIERINFLLTI
jgi:hypothetical protein